MDGSWNLDVGGGVKRDGCTTCGMTAGRPECPNRRAINSLYRISAPDGLGVPPYSGVGYCPSACASSAAPEAPSS